ncbi:hypothetical protein BCV69DRAFT_312929 [Microstroma glucosiphilum]|uniref:TOG domain-containing protein n=1 Tax=Pseudomicrostroma glucosiphilum TaxID=1684307 RepID=A0A316U7K2_9BASI|nr:hypothetical protein BCV69DRAFT_312929 [Pseudomicrostroma glucosiphilum]PWN20333.1 hypothetical protein BCV69DRAFT_312929 [Pseudomicrostroma glucosiphilum]
MASYYDDEGEDDVQRFQDLVDSIDAATDLDGKTSALQHLSDHLPTFHSIPEADHLTATLKVLIKNQHPTLSHAALEFVSPLLAHMRSSIHEPKGVQHVKTAINSLMPTVLEKAGDGREKTREMAGKALEELGKAAIDGSRATLGHSISHKTREIESPLNAFERLLCDTGLMAKSAKIKEQSCKVLPPLRSYQAKLPIKAFLSPLVEILSDADPHCREAARATLVALFSTASPAAKTDLKKELEAQNVRKALVDSIVREISSDDDEDLSGDGVATPVAAERAASSTSHAAPAAASSATTAPAPAATAASDDNISPVHIFSRGDLERAFTALLPHFEGKETEHNWLQRENGIIKVRGMLKAGAFDKYDAAFVSGIKSLTDGVLKAVGSLRTTLAMQGTCLIAELAQRVGDSLADSTLDAFVPALLKMAGYTKRLVANATQEAVKELFQTTSYRHRFLDLVWAGMQDKNITTRISMAEHLHTLLATHAEHRKHALESHEGLATIEKFLQKGLADQNKDVRANSREAFYVYRHYWPARGHALESKLEPAIRKQIAAGAASAAMSSGPVRPAGTGAQARAVSSALPPSRSEESPSTSKPAVAVVPPKRAGGPSSAILAAKARMVAERKEQQARQQRESQGSQRDDYAGSPQSASETTPKKPSLSQTRQFSASRIPRAADVPLPPSPSSSSASLSSATTPTRGATQGGRAGSALSPPSRATPRGIGKEASSASSPPPSSYGGQQPQQRFQPFQPTRARNVSTSTAGSSSASASSSGSANARPMSGYAGGNKSLGAVPSAKGKAVPTSPASRTAALPAKMLDPDDTIQLGRYDADATLDGDATVDLMGMSSSPLKRAMAAGGGDDSLSFAFAGLGQQTKDNRAADDEDDEDEQYNGDETNQSTPRIIRQAPADGQGGAQPQPQSSSSSDALAFTSPSSEAEVQAPPQRAPPPVSPAEGKSYLASRASRLTSEAQIALSPIKSTPDALQWVEEVRTGRANAVTFGNLSIMSRKFPVQAEEDSAANEQLLRSGRGAYEAEEAAKRRMQQEEEGDGDGESLEQQQADAWRELSLFCSLWEALERSLLALFAAPASAGENIPPADAGEIPMAALSLLFHLVERQYPLFLSYGLEVDLLSLIFKVRASVGSGSNGGNASASRRGATPPTKVISGCESLIDSWAARTLPALGLSSLLSSMGPAPSLSAPDTDAEGAAAAASDSRILLLSLRALSRLLLRLPPEMVLEEIPRARSWILRALNDEKVTALRQAAVDVVSCAQVRIEQGRAGEGEDGEATGSASAAAGEKENGVTGNDASGATVSVEELFESVGPLKQAQKDLIIYFIGRKKKLLAQEAARARAGARR